MLAGHSDTGELAIKRVEVVQVGEHDITYLCGCRRGNFRTGLKVVRHFPEDPRAALGGTPDEQTIGARTIAALAGESMSPFASTGMDTEDLILRIVR